jgi:hypothetical protein
MGKEPVPETLYSNELTRLCAREDYIERLTLKIAHFTHTVFMCFVFISEQTATFTV